ncbi:MAG TPA: ATP-binding cassette domain-containing protein [Methylibium sp.]|uniref:ATP-binding cassette domain-containing protein n=1 Tax=Methylibium sp. TaxID=2067992 RepID=UPI002DBD494B|nr:ATP-binding cassette domain-containing protein [Methylibium sp.]HEU4459128.1 ATP-binding cassette domain-containing protein [Methylibium sp.]
MLQDEASFRSRVFAALWSSIWRHRRRALLALALLVAAKLAGVAVPWLLKKVVDRFSAPGGLAGDVAGLVVGPPAADVPVVLVVPVFLLVGYALLRFSSTLFTELRDLVFARVTHATVADFAERSFAQLLALGHRFHARRQTGTVLRDVERGTRGIGYLLGAALFTVVPTLIEFSAVLLVMSAGYGWSFTAVILATFVLYAAYTVTLTQRRVVHQRRLIDMDARAAAHLVDSLINFDAVKAFATEAHERERHHRLWSQAIDEQLASQRALSALHVGQGAIIALGVAAVMLLAGEQTARGAMTVGDLVLVNAYVIQICLPLNALGFVFREAKDALVNTERLFTLLEEEPEVRDAAQARELELRGAAVAFERVSFGYEPGRTVIADLSLSIPAGSTVAVVGGSGSGKSTLARLLLRQHDPQAGRITIDGQDVAAVPLASLRRAIGVVLQDTVLFNDTIVANIAYGRLGAGVAEVVEAAKAAQVHEFVTALPQQYDTVVGERGLKLSGGEKQRIAIARAVLKNAPILIFDEATSALDTRAERAIQTELERLSRERTTLVIAHRLSTVVNADEIVVMDKGRIVERGRHEALLERDGLYAQLWSLQLQQRQFEQLERKLARQPVNLELLLAPIVDGLREALDAAQVRLYTELLTGDASVTGDPHALGDALHAVLQAALQATPPGGRIALRLERAGPELRFAVTDGRHQAATPVAPARRGRAGADAARPEPGEPLDPLALRSVIERQGGRFRIEAPGAAHGMRYVVELPLRAIAVPATSRHAEAEASTRLDGLAVLCIDDQRDALEALAGMLETRGATVLGFERGDAALDWLRAQPASAWPQLFVCDISLGEEDGHDVVRGLRRLEAERGVPLEQRLPALALTGHAQASDRVEALLAGFQSHLGKPADPRELISTLAALAGATRGAG